MEEGDAQQRREGVWQRSAVHAGMRPRLAAPVPAVACLPCASRRPPSSCLTGGSVPKATSEVLPGLREASEAGRGSAANAAPRRNARAATSTRPGARRQPAARTSRTIGVGPRCRRRSGDAGLRWARGRRAGGPAEGVASGGQHMWGRPPAGMSLLPRGRAVACKQLQREPGPGGGGTLGPRAQTLARTHLQRTRPLAND